MPVDEGHLLRAYAEEGYVKIEIQDELGVITHTGEPLTWEGRPQIDINKITIMWKDTPQMEICLSPDKPIATMVAKDKCAWWLLPTRLGHYNLLELFLRTRLPDEQRGDIKQILERYGVETYEPYEMCRKSHGRTMEDFLWLKFDDEDITFEDIRLR